MLNTVSIENVVRTIESYIKTEILEEIKNSEDGLKVIYNDDNDNEPSCVMMSWDKFKDLIEDNYLLGISEERVKRLERGESKTISREEMMQIMGITQEELDEMEDVEIE